MRAEGPARDMEKEILGGGVVVVVSGAVTGGELAVSERELEAWRVARLERDCGAGWARGCERRSE